MSSSPAIISGVLEISPKGFGFLRDPSKHYAARANDPHVSHDLIRQHKLRSGALITGPVAPPARGQNGPRLGAVDTIEGFAPADFRPRKWDELTAIDPTRWLKLETGAEPLTTRVMDLFTPVGLGQRGLIVAPPRTGKTVLLAHIAAAVSALHPDVHLMMLLIDERPEEVTEMRRTVKGEVIASSNDQETAVHVRTAELVLERAKRMVEQGRDVLILLDSLTRLARAYNKHSGNSGRTMSGGVDSRALEVPKRLFGSARAFEEGGTLTILGSALIETGSRMDDVIFQEFKGTGNMELVLDRRLADKRIFPAIDLLQSGTRKEERLIPAERLERINLLRRTMLQVKRADEAMEVVVQKMSKTKSNDEFLDMVGKFVAK
jgi:transcription termination factor Rho